MKLRMKGPLSLFILLTALAAHAQPSPYSNALFNAVTMTATGQTSAPIKMAQYSASGGAFNLGTVTLKATTLTTVTFGVLGSADNGVTYFPLNIWNVLTPDTTATTATATATGLYQFSLAGITHIEFVTSGTFTATGVAFALTATPAPSVSKRVVGGSGGDVDSVFGRDGDVIAESGDYSFSLISGSISGTQLPQASFTWPGGSGLAIDPVNGIIDALDFVGGAFSGDGSALTNLQAGNIASGTLDAARLPTGSAITWTGAQAFNGGATAPTASPGTNTTQVATTAFVAATLPLGATTPSLGGTLIAVGCSNQTTVTITGAATTMGCVMSGTAGNPANIEPQCSVSATNTVTPQLCTSIALGVTPTAQTYNIRVIR